MRRALPFSSGYSWDGVEGSILWPETAANDFAASAKNDDSLVRRLKFGSLGVLLPGDAEKEAEPYGHPRQELFERLENVGVRIVS